MMDSKWKTRERLVGMDLVENALQSPSHVHLVGRVMRVRVNLVRCLWFSQEAYVRWWTNYWGGERMWE